MVDFKDGILSSLPPRDQFTKDELIVILAKAAQEAYDRAVAEAVRLIEERLETAVNAIEALVHDRISALARDFERRINGEANGD